MKVIGAGFGRTGTLSLKLALNDLGFGPCYHMTEVITHPHHVALWQAVTDGETINWESIFADYQSTVDYPASVHYQKILEAYPSAKVLLTVRDADRWYESTYETIYTNVNLPLLKYFPPIGRFIKMTEDTMWNGLFDGRFEDRDYAITVYHDWIDSVKAHVPAEQLLVFNVKDGWEPLCGFLGVPVPDKPFPHTNQRRMMKGLKGVVRILAILIPLIGAGFILFIAWLIFG